MSELREAKAKLRESLKDESGIAGFGVGDGTLRVYISKESARVLVPKNYEGVRVACTVPEEDGWFLLRLSLHDPVLPLNIESNVAGGVAQIAGRLRSFFTTQTGLDLSALS